MIRALYSAASGMTAQQLNVDNIAHNLANANTVGFKMRRTQFQDLLYQNMIQPGAAAGAQTVVPTGLQIGLGSRPSSNEIIFSQGEFQQTDNPLDMVIQGKGFFQVRRPNGELAYTRSGNFHLDRDGNVVTSDGNPLEPQITIPPDAQTITIAQDGTVSFTQPGQTAAQLAGQIQLANFQNPGGPEQPGRQPVHADRCFGRRDRGQPGRPGGPRFADAGLPGRLECVRGGRVHQSDRQPARLRGEFQSGQGGRRDVSTGQPDLPMMILLLAACLPLAGDGDRITAADLAAAEPGFSAVPPETPMGYAPVPGTPRILGVAELARQARRYGLDFEPKAEICVERPVEPLSPAAVLEAMRSSLGLPEARIEIVEQSRYPVPHGALEFPRTGLVAALPFATAGSRAVEGSGTLRR